MCIHGCSKEVHFAQLHTRRGFAMPSDIDRQTTFGGQNCLLLEQKSILLATCNTKSNKCENWRLYATRF